MTSGWQPVASAARRANRSEDQPPRTPTTASRGAEWFVCAVMDASRQLKSTASGRTKSSQGRPRCSATRSMR
jgi:hypothetical protein